MLNRSQKILEDLFFKFKKGNFDSNVAFKIEEIYGRWGMTFAFNVGIFLWPVSLTVTTIMLVIFKRRKLLGVTQKFIISIMVIDLCFLLTSVVRDTLLKVFHMNYGFLEYRVCAEIFYSMRIQMILHATSSWLSTLMSVHHLLLVGFPIRVKMCNLSAYFVVFLIGHVLFCCTFLLLLITPDYEPIPLIQEYKRGYPSRKIDGCVADTAAHLAGMSFPDLVTIIMFVIVLYSQMIPFCLHLAMTVGLVVFLNRNIRSLSVLTNNISLKRVNYVKLMKINIGLGLTSILQELPFVIVLFSQFRFNSWENPKKDGFLSYQGLATSVISISYNIGKPINLFIYASLSSSFRQELNAILKRMFRQTNKPRSSKQAN